MKLAAVDFLHTRTGRRVGWILLAMGTTGFAAAIWYQRSQATERDEALRAQQARTAALQAKPKPVRSLEPSASQRRFQQAQAELQRPWMASLRAIEAATVAPVYLLSLTIEPTTGLVKLEAESPTFRQALAYVELLDQSGALQRATLLSHAQSAAASLPPVDYSGIVRFTVATHWNLR